MWYAEQISVQLEDAASVEDAFIEPVDLCMARMKEVNASWVVEMWDYIANNSQFTVNGFVHVKPLMVKMMVTSLCQKSPALQQIRQMKNHTMILSIILCFKILNQSFQLFNLK